MFKKTENDQFLTKKIEVHPKSFLGEALKAGSLQYGEKDGKMTYIQI